MEKLAKSHRGCPKARGCGCLTDRAIALLEKTEHDLFELELEAYAGDSGITPDAHGGYDPYAKMHAEQSATEEKI